jgi:hypothetical protein
VIDSQLGFFVYRIEARDAANADPLATARAEVVGRHLEWARQEERRRQLSLARANLAVHIDTAALSRTAE